LLIVAAYIGLRIMRAPKKAEVHAEYTLHGESDGRPRLADLISRLAEVGRTVDVVGFDGSGMPRATIATDSPLVGSQVRMRLRGSTEPLGVNLRLRREAERGVFGLLEIDDDATHIHRRLGADVVRQLEALMPGIVYASHLTNGPQAKAAELEATEELS
jgi:hypothetical protein